MKQFNNFLYSTIALVCLVVNLMPNRAMAQQSGITRTNHQRHDISVAGWETIQASIAFDKGISFGMHSHPGEEVIYVLKGVFGYQIEGEKPIRLKAGDVLFIPAGKNHSAKNYTSGLLELYCPPH